MSSSIQIILHLTHNQSVFERVNSLVCNRNTIFSAILTTMSQDPVFEIQMTVITLRVMPSIKKKKEKTTAFSKCKWCSWHMRKQWCK